MSETDLAEVWARSLEELATMQIEPHQRAWLKLTRPLGLVENTALIATPNEFVKEQLETRLRALITHALSRELGRSIQLAVTVDPTAISAATAFPAPAPGGGMPAPGPDPGIAACGAGSTVTASWMSRPSCCDRAWVTSARSRVSSCSLTNSFGVAMSAVFSTRPSGLVSFSQAR